MTPLILFFIFRHVFSQFTDCECTGDNSLIPESNPTFYGTGYGIYCEAWDIDRDYCDVDDITYSGGNGKEERKKDETAENNWCSQPWCYVQKGCIVGERDWHKKEDISDTADSKQTVVFTDDDGKPIELYYSYLHCGPFKPNGIEWPDFEPCQERKNPVDVYFLVDGSTSIDDESWANQGYFLSQLIKESLTVDGDRVGIAQFSGKMQMHFTFNDKLSDVGDGALVMEQLKGGTKTDEGIKTVMDQWEKEDYKDPWDGDDRKRLFVLVTDGVPNPRTANPCYKNDKQKELLERMKKLNTINVIIAVDMAIEDRSVLSCLVEKPLLNIVHMDDFESFDQYRDPTGSQNLLCADPSTLQKKADKKTNRCTKSRRLDGKMHQTRCEKRRRCLWYDNDCHFKIHCLRLNEETCKNHKDQCRPKYRKDNGKFKKCQHI